MVGITINYALTLKITQQSNIIASTYLKTMLWVATEPLLYKNGTNLTAGSSGPKQ